MRRNPWLDLKPCSAFGGPLRLKSHPPSLCQQLFCDAASKQLCLTPTVGLEVQSEEPHMQCLSPLTNLPPQNAGARFKCGVCGER